MPDRPYATRLEELPTHTQEVVGGLRDGLIELFGADLAAIWLYGATLFTPVALDIDLHIVLRRRPDAPDGEGIRHLHEAVSHDRRWSDELDTWYILLEDARRPEPPPNVGPWHPGIVDEHWALHRAHWLAGACIVVQGMSPSDVVVAPSWWEIEAALHAELEAAGKVEYGSEYWVLQLCRVLASAETGDVVRSKLDSGRWAIERLGEDVRPIVETAISCYHAAGDEDDIALIWWRYPGFYEMVRPLIEEGLEARSREQGAGNRGGDSEGKA